MWRNDLAYLFPIRSQSDPNDRHWLVQLIEHVRSQQREYRYMEVGSYLGGTLTPALLDEACVEVLSIDLRPKLQPDARNIDYDYSQFCTATMLRELAAHGLTDIAKLTTFDGCAHECDFRDKKYHMAFIDAEHTDSAVFRDFMAIYDHLEAGAICAFHDTELVTFGLENILTFLEHQRRAFWFGVFRDSAVSAIFLDVTQAEMPRGFLDNVWIWQVFKSQARDRVLMSAIKNRLAITLGLNERRVVPM